MASEKYEWLRQLEREVSRFGPESLPERRVTCRAVLSKPLGACHLEHVFEHAKNAYVSL